MPLFRMDVILTSKRSSYLFRGTREPHFHSEHSFHLVYLRWVCWLLRVGTIDLLLFYRFNIPFRMHCWCLFISHIYFCETLRLCTFFFLSAFDLQITHLIGLGSKAISSRVVQHTIRQYTDEKWGDAYFSLPVVLLRDFLVKLKAKDLQSAWFGNVLWTKIPNETASHPKVEIRIFIYSD